MGWLRDLRLGSEAESWRMGVCEGIGPAGGVMLFVLR